VLPPDGRRTGLVDERDQEEAVGVRRPGQDGSSGQQAGVGRLHVEGQAADAVYLRHFFPQGGAARDLVLALPATTAYKVLERVA